MILAQYVGLKPDVTENGQPLSHKSEPTLVDEEHPHIQAMMERGDLLWVADAPEEPTRSELIERAKALGHENAHRTTNTDLKAFIAERENEDNPDEEGDGS